jgi:uncharacterized iron-regulated membrane protein
VNAHLSPKPRHWLLAKSRQWHQWGGLLAGLFLLLVGATGIVLNYKQPLFRALGLDRKPPSSQELQSRKPATASLHFSTASGGNAWPVSLDRALSLARAEWGDVPLERIELKTEHGEALYKIKRRGGSELWVNAVTGAHLVKGPYERLGKAGADGAPTRSTDWGKILIDLHTGKIGGEVGKALVSFAALLLLLLTLSGIYMWLKPLLIRRQHASTLARAAVVPELPVRATASPRSAELVEM